MGDKPRQGRWCWRQQEPGGPQKLVHPRMSVGRTQAVTPTQVQPGFFLLICVFHAGEWGMSLSLLLG